MRQTIILAAGAGSRINSRHRGVPKPLIPVAGRPLLERTLGQARDAGCTEAVVVVGNGADQVTAWLDSTATGIQVSVVMNPRFDLPNGTSLLAAERCAAPRFFLQMADHVFAEPVLPLLAEAAAADPDATFLLVDRTPQRFDEDDATTVRLDAEDRVIAIGKGVRPWDAVDAGVFLLDHRAFDAMRTAAGDGPPSVSAGMRELVRRRLLAAVDLGEVPWADVDTAADLLYAGQSIAPAADLVDPVDVNMGVDS